MKSILLVWCLSLLTWPGSHTPWTDASAHTETETLRMEANFPRLSSASTLMLSNIHGSIEVEGYSGRNIQIEVLKTVDAKTRSIALKGLTELKLAEEVRGDTLELILDFPWEKVNGSQGNFKNLNGYHRNGWKWNPDYEFKLDFRIKVPKQINLKIATVNNGQIEVQDVYGNLSVNHVNGSIDLQDIKGRTEVHTINGDVNLVYAAFPRDDSRFFSHNGTINLSCPKGLSANMFFKSYHGEFFTNLDQLSMGEDEVQKTTHRGEEGIEYSISSRRALISRDGGVTLEFETFNGDVYVEEGK